MLSYLEHSPRMYHRMATGIEDAGFEIRDQIQYLYGTGFPKSHNISIAIDKLYEAERTVVGENPNRKGRENWNTNPKNITLPATESAEYWNGWGIGLIECSTAMIENLSATKSSGLSATMALRLLNSVVNTRLSYLGCP